jgi:hypothetical protein
MPSLNTKLATAPNVSANYILKATTSTTIGNSLIFDNGTAIAIGNGLSSATPQLGLIEATDGSGTNIAGAELRLQGGQGTGTGAGGALTFYTSAAGSSGSSTNNALERMRIVSNGNVGIGTTNTTARFNIQASANFETPTLGAATGTMGYLSANGLYGMYIGIGNSGNTWLQSQRNDGATTAYNLLLNPNGGNVGIGTSSPANYFTTTLTIDGSSSQGIMFRASGTDRGFLFQDGSFIQLGSNAGGVIFKSNDTERMRITSGGIIYALNNGVDANYQPMIGGMYRDNTNETNLILTAVSSAASQSGFRFDVSNGAGSTGRTTSMTINRSSVTIVGSLSKGSGSFKIEHPLDSKKDTHHLVHSFVESPQANNIYRGKVQLVDGKAEVNLDEVSTMTEGTFVLLNREIHTYTSNETDWYAVRGNVIGNILHIECQNEESNAIVSWLVIGERQDKHMMDTEWTDENGKVIVEPLKQIITTEQQ